VTLKKPRLDYKWIILAISFLMEFMALGFCSSNVGLYTVPITNALGIDRLAYSYVTSIRYGVQVIVALYFGTLLNRFGVRKMVFAGLLAIISSTVLRMTGTNIFHFYLAGALTGIGIIFTGNAMAGTIVRRWFNKDIGKYTGIVMSANGIGAAIAAQIVSPIINNGETFGYRKAYLLCAVLHLMISIIIISFIRETPDGSRIVTTKEKKTPKKGVIWAGIEFHILKKKAYFYISVLLIFLTGLCLQSIGNISIVYMTDLGISPAFIATTSTVGALTLTFSKMAVGTAYDKWGLRTALLISLIAGMAGFALNGLMNNSALGLVLAMASVICCNLAMPLQTVILPLLSNDLFGYASFDKVLGIFLSANSLGLCLGTPMGELLRKLTGTYRICFWLFNIVLVVVIIAYQFILKVANKEKAAVLAAK